MRINGKEAIKAPAISNGYSVAYSPWNDAIPIDSTLIESELVTTRGQRKSFHAFKIVKIAKATNAGFDKGRITLQ